MSDFELAVEALTDVECSDKEILAEVHARMPNNPHVPAVEYFGVTEDDPMWLAPEKRVTIW